MCCSVLRCVAVGERERETSEHLSREESAKFKKVRDAALRCSALQGVAKCCSCWERKSDNKDLSR